jgi:lysozyme
MSKQEPNQSIIKKVGDKIKSFTMPDAKKIAIKIIKDFEGCKLKAYKCPAGVWTIGYGHTNGVKQGMEITQKQSEKFLEDDLKIYYDCVINEVRNHCSANQIASLTSFAFNVGNENFKRSTLLKVIKSNPNNFGEIEKQFMRWVFAGSKTPIKGLKTRRKMEAELYKKA